jgi:hypothetical protein
LIVSKNSSNAKPRGSTSADYLIRRLSKDWPDVLSLFEQAVARGRGGANNPEGLGGRGGKEGEIDNVRDTNIDNQPEQEAKPRGGSDDRGYAIRRLSKDRPDLLARGEQGELSPHRAMRATITSAATGMSDSGMSQVKYGAPTAPPVRQTVLGAPALERGFFS